MISVDRSERVLNGSIFALYGLYDYIRLVPESTQSSSMRALAARLFDGGVTTVRANALNVFRAPGCISRLIQMLHNIRDAHYQEVHTQQLLQLEYLTGQSWFAQASDLFRGDYPDASQPGSVAFAAGSHLAYRFDGASKITASMSRKLPTPSGAPNGPPSADPRGRGIYFHITKGVFAGWWVPEVWPATYQRSVLLRHDYFPSRQVTLRAGTWTAYRYNSSAAALAHRTGSYASPTSAPVSASAVIHGQLHLLISRGRYAGYWLPMTSGVTLV